jgi:tetratricopeptide (TPR) repeat protein
MLLCARRWRSFSLLYLYAAGVVSLFLVAHVVSRYRQPLVIPLALFAALALVEAWEALKGRRALVPAAILACGVALSFALPDTPPKGYRYYRPAEFIIASERLESEGDVKRAGAEYRQAIALALKEYAPEKERIDLGLGMGDLFLRHQHYPEALSAYRDVLEDDPLNEEALIATGGIQHDTNQPIEALSMLLRAESVDPNNAEVEARLGHLFWVTFHDGAKALPRLRKALELAPNSPAAADLSAFATAAAAATGLTP